jgi:hypothetical protein
MSHINCTFGGLMNQFLASLGATTLLLIVGCAAPVAAPQGQKLNAQQGILDVKIESSNAASVTLTGVFWSNDANNQRVADAECAKHGKVAQFVAKEKDRRRYNCVKP